ncbi:unnamed protein product, partial [Allacma fusca]
MCTYRSRRNEHAVDLATNCKTFCKRFDRRLGLCESNQEQIQDVTGHMNLKSEVDANSFEPLQRSLSKRFCKNLENVCSERGVVGAAAIDALHTGFNSSTVASAIADKNSNENPVETGARIGLNSPVVSNGLSDDVVFTDPEEMLHLEIPDDQNSLDGMLNTIEASPEFERIWARVSELCRQRGMEFDDEMKAGLPHWYAQRRIKNLKNMACPILYI